ncbi:MAG: coiled-coil protein [Candidatus Thalassarchaeaceae archaeon]|tara:strand:- start:6 stop:857 length:852 start_codon:yes stop_codon:yes gene_type:complete
MDYKEVGKIFNPLSDKISLELNINKEQRDEWNNRVRRHLDNRNEVNIQVKELISEVQKQKIVRDAANVRVKELKDIRFSKSEKLKKIRREIRERFGDENIKPDKKGGPDPRRIKAEMDKLENMYERGAFSGKKEKEFINKMKKLTRDYKEAKKSGDNDSIGTIKKNEREAKYSQAKAHDDVENAVKDAQEAHDLMMELSEEVDRLREIANNSQKEVTISKREADIMHSRYVVSLRCIHSMQDLLKEMSVEDVEDEKVEMSDLMSRLMSGDTLSTDELMSLQRN